ncbi:MAG TPA: non-homologous end-joining DNA ligase [Methanoregulaceae archaeon]|nr:non-homologous end-joining DNA ligase [Methanoregulaceae archaeon]
MLASPSTPFSDQHWIYEPKFDGTRCIAHISGDEVFLQNRRMAGITGRYPEIIDGFSTAVEKDCVLDGEIVILKQGRTDFPSLQSREGKIDPFRIKLMSRALPATFIVFDILYRGKKSLMKSPLSDRLEVLKESLHANERVEICRHISGEGELYFQASVSMGMEGVIAKKRDSLYYPGKRSHEWLKFKNVKGYDMVIAGYTRGKGMRRNLFGALILGVYDNSGDLVYAGKVGSGFSVYEMEDLLKRLRILSVSPLKETPIERDITWVSPDLAIEVKALEVTSNKKLRAPVFLRIKHDKPPAECGLDQLSPDIER